MFETDEVDVDLFTPASGTSLANIFKNSQVEKGTVKATLKYIPEHPPTRAKPEEKPEDTKPTECIFACASYAYEWINNSYVNKGKLGFALMKILKNGTHNFILYDANKVTLSCATLTAVFEVHVKENYSISYYDNAQKYWNICAKEIHKVLEILKGLNVTLKQSTEQENGPPKSDSIDQNKDVDDNKDKLFEDKTSDTDSSIHRKTKDSILKRMASMGHSVLPSTQINIESTDSSDSNNSCNIRRLSKHKQLKSYNTHSNTDKEELETVDGKVFVKKSVLKNKPPYGTSSDIYEDNKEIVPCQSLQIVNNARDEISSLGISDISLLISEQRVNNSELRINMSRISDKLDIVIDKIKQSSISDKDSSASNYQNIIVQKLLNEYETKIKKYEEFIQTHDLENERFKLDRKNNTTEDKLGCKKISESNEEKDIIISQLKDEINKLTEQNEHVAQKEKSYLDEIKNLQKEMELKDEQLFNLNKKIEDTSSNFQKSDDAKNKIKSLMNDTFQSIAANFANEESYNGAKVKNIVAAIIKKTTIEAISDL